jgi:hypothetical protein
MSTFAILLGVAVIAYRVFAKGESIIVKNPNWRLRGLAILAMGLALVAMTVYQLILFHLHNVPILSIMWAMLAAGIVCSVVGVCTMQRVSRV